MIQYLSTGDTYLADKAINWTAASRIHGLGCMTNLTAIQRTSQVVSLSKRPIAAILAKDRRTLSTTKASGSVRDCIMRGRMNLCRFALPTYAATPTKASKNEHLRIQSLSLR